ncbi:MFS transporter [Bradyrhizobium sp. U531]|uniref:MFS transporter n=1 Tax=Bradyrhizobium sp. U531 TaxID=3053458 RepID=UPI003F42FD2E
MSRIEVAYGDASIDTTTEEHPSAWKPSLIASLGSVVEYYDFALYGLLASTISPLFFPNQSSAEGLLVTLAIFGSAFIVRPIGGLVFGWLGDRRGRNSTLIFTVLGTGISSAAIGLLPTYANVGLLAGIALLTCRLAQGFFAGGEVCGAVTYIAEIAPPNRRGFFGAFNPAGVSVGFSLAAVIAGILQSLLTSEQMFTWGWRVPFLLCLPLVALTVYARMMLEDTPRFKRLAAERQVARAPVIEVVTVHGVSLVKVIAIASAQSATAYLGLVYFNLFLTRTLGYDKAAVFWLMTVAPLSAAFLMPLFGGLSDRVGRLVILKVAYVGYIVVLPAALWTMKLGFPLACVATIVAFIPFAATQSTGYPLYGELFPTHVRYSGVSLGFNIATILGGATTPYVATWLLEKTGDYLSPSYFVMALAAIGVIALLTIRETAHQNLPD